MEDRSLLVKSRKEEIEQAATQYGLLNPVIHYDADGNSYDDHDKPTFDYIAGAEWADENPKEKAMTREEWKEVIGRAAENARHDFYWSRAGSKEENNLQLITGLLNYIHDVL